uniref:Uncharacterized protein n=1 Tax=Glossina brevipalpis TaxID=37001 RepID=A0A1A9VZZ1_9MUSC
MDQTMASVGDMDGRWNDFIITSSSGDGFKNRYELCASLYYFLIITLLLLLLLHKSFLNCYAGRPKLLQLAFEPKYHLPNRICTTPRIIFHCLVLAGWFNVSMVQAFVPNKRTTLNDDNDIDDDDDDDDDNNNNDDDDDDDDGDDDDDNGKARWQRNGNVSQL